jgi:hypothetical protein
MIMTIAAAANRAEFRGFASRNDTCSWRGMTIVKAWGAVLVLAATAIGTTGCAGAAGDDDTTESDSVALVSHGVSAATWKHRVKLAVSRGNHLGLVCHLTGIDGEEVGWAARCYHGRRTPAGADHPFVRYGRGLGLRCGHVRAGGENGIRPETYCLWDRYM